MTEKGSKHYWSECGQICFVDGKGYGLTPEPRSICLRKEEDIKKFLGSHLLSKWAEASDVIYVAGWDSLHCHVNPLL